MGEKDKSKLGILFKEYLKLVSLLGVILLVILQANAATIKGTAYYPDIKPVKGVIIEINTTPIQRFIANDGTYLFSLPVGTYNVTATFETPTEYYRTDELIVVNTEGRYLRDLVLKVYPKNSTNIDEELGKNRFFQEYKRFIYYGIGIIIGLFMIWISYTMIKKSMKDDDKNVQSKSGK